MQFRRQLHSFGLHGPRRGHVDSMIPINNTGGSVHTVWLPSRFGAKGTSGRACPTVWEPWAFLEGIDCTRHSAQSFWTSQFGGAHHMSTEALPLQPLLLPHTSCGHLRVGSTHKCCVLSWDWFRLRPSAVDSENNCLREHNIRGWDTTCLVHVPTTSVRSDQSFQV
jgi:hypothetical protein